ncbi:MAG: DegT/DnrJ/EryC1/StrS family aminotransferase [Bacteroidales bacterium]
MNEIQMVDLKTQYKKIRDEIDNAIFSVIHSTAFIRGPGVRLFEDEMKAYLGVSHVVSCGNGTDALQIVMMSLGLKPGDEVITTDFTFIATVETVALLGLKPVLVDPDPGTFNISLKEIEKAITPRTKAIIPVHLFGQCADMEGIMKLAREHGLHVIEDAAQATGAGFRLSDGVTAKAGTIGVAGTTSFFPSKNLGCYGDGGAIFTNDDNLAAKARSIANHGMKERYHYDDIGLNSRLDTIQAGILSVKLKYLDKYNEARKAAASYYDNAFSGCSDIIIPSKVPGSDHIYHQYTIRVRDRKRDALKKHLSEHGIPSMIYDPAPLHSQAAYSYLGLNDTGFPVTCSLCGEVLSLPMHTEMDEEQLRYITGNVLEFFERK